MTGEAVEMREEVEATGEVAAETGEAEVTEGINAKGQQQTTSNLKH
jgi:hypothetical protein